MEFKSLLDAVQTIGTGKLYTVTIEYRNATCGTTSIVGIYDNQEEAEDEAGHIWNNYKGENALCYRTSVEQYDVTEDGEIGWKNGRITAAFGCEEAEA